MPPTTITGNQTLVADARDAYGDVLVSPGIARVLARRDGLMAAWRSAIREDLREAGLL